MKHFTECPVCKEWLEGDPKGDQFHCYFGCYEIGVDPNDPNLLMELFTSPVTRRLVFCGHRSKNPKDNKYHGNLLVETSPGGEWRVLTKPYKRRPSIEKIKKLFDQFTNSKFMTLM